MICKDEIDRQILPMIQEVGRILVGPDGDSLVDLGNWIHIQSVMRRCFEIGVAHGQDKDRA